MSTSMLGVMSTAEIGTRCVAKHEFSVDRPVPATSTAPTAAVDSSRRVMGTHENCTPPKPDSDVGQQLDFGHGPWA
jgi:hypothetical protein